MESLAEALKIFLEKLLIPTVISLFGAGIVILFIPNDSWMIKKITVTGVYLLIAAGLNITVRQSRQSGVARFFRNYPWEYPKVCVNLQKFFGTKYLFTGQPLF